jgi:hypothetical protein
MFSHGTAQRTARARFAARPGGYHRLMLYTIFIILAIVALVLFIFGRRSI